MKSIILFALFFVVSQFGICQSSEYTEFILKADSLYRAKDYKNSAMESSKAFKSWGWKGYSDDRYNAACSWALANEKDSAFYQINIIVMKAKYKNISHILSDSDLTSLHDDKRWKEVIDLVAANKEKAEENLDKPIAARLDSIYDDDQNGRQKLSDIESKYGDDSKELHALWNEIQSNDSINLIKVKEILDTRGWLGQDIVGETGNLTLFLVIQHSDITTQEKYLPMMREAVKKGNAQASNLALMEDRVALRHGKKQIYGSQINRDVKTNTSYVAPLDDPDNVDIRRAEVGLEPLAVYLLNWNLKWDVEEYKKQLPVIMSTWKFE